MKYIALVTSQTKTAMESPEANKTRTEYALQSVSSSYLCTLASRHVRADHTQEVTCFRVDLPRIEVFARYYWSEKDQRTVELVRGQLHAAKIERDYYEAIRAIVESLQQPTEGT